MAAKQFHRSSKSSEIFHVLSTSELHSVYRSPPLLSTSSAFTLQKPLLSKVLKPRRKVHSIKAGLKSTRGQAIPVKVGKSMSMSVKDPLFDFDSSILRSKEDTLRTAKAATELSYRRKLQSGSIKNSPKSLVNFPSSERVNREQFESQVIFLELKLTEQLKQAHKASNTPLPFESQFPIYTQVFQDVIDRDKQFGSLLAKIKTFYDSWLFNFSTHSHDPDSHNLYNECAEQLKVAKHKLKLCSEDKKLMLRRIGAMSKETVEMGRNLQELEAENEELKGKIEEIRRVNIDKIPKDERTWKCLVVENRSYQSEVHRLCKKLKIASQQSESLQAFILRMKDRGFPIEELDESQSHPATNSNSDFEDAEPIISGPAKNFEKPRGVPSLELKGLSNGEDESESPQQNEGAERVVDILESMDRGVIDDFQAFLTKEVMEEKPNLDPHVVDFM